MPRPSPITKAQPRTADERRRRLEEIFLEYAPHVLDYARYRGATLAEAEDVVSEVFTVLTRRLDDAPADVLPWLFAVARKAFSNQMRGERRRLALASRLEQEALSQPQAVTPPSAGGPHGVLVREALSRLPAREHEAVVLVTWDGLTYEGAAEAMGCTVAAFAQLVRRARQRLSAIMEEARTREETDLTLSESNGP